MRILQVHNAYNVGRGGEDSVVDNERRLLEEGGHEVVFRSVATSDESIRGPLQLMRTARNSIYSREARGLVRQWVREVAPDVVHVHNTFPLLSPAVFHEFDSLGVPSVLTLHNYRLVCANALFLRDGKACDDCLGGSPWNAVRHRCYRGSRLGSAVQASTRVVHERLGTYREKVDAIIVLSEFAKQIFAKAGIPRERLYVKPNFVLPRATSSTPAKKQALMFLGKIVPEKGLGDLLAAWRDGRPSGWELWVVGDGPLRNELQEAFANVPDIVWHGWKGSDDVRSLVSQASWLVLPSVWYEGFPMVLPEAFAEGTPAIVPNRGAMPEIVGNGERGLVYDGSPDGLTTAIRIASEVSPEEYARYGRAARAAVAGQYAPEANRERLLCIYEAAIERKRSSHVAV